MRQAQRVFSPALILTMSAFAVSVAAALPVCRAQESRCAKLTSAGFEHMNVVSATPITAGGATFLNASTSPLGGVDPASLPAFCRVIVESHPVPDSKIGIEVWLPEQWTGRLVGLGNGGLGGTIYFSNLATMMAMGSIAVATDTGHVDPTVMTRSESGPIQVKSAIPIDWAKNQDSLIDYGYRAIHEAAEAAKKIAFAFYGKPVNHSYFAGCSTGGRQAAAEAERYPDDYDGILMGAPALDWSSQHAGQIFEAQQTLLQPDHFVPREKLVVVRAAAIQKCDALDGTKDGLIADPRRCNFDPSVLLCKAGDKADCLTSGQLDALQKIYKGPVNSKGDKIFYGAMPGGEVELFTNTAKMPDTDMNIADFNIINHVSDFNWRTMDFATQVQKSRESVGSVIDATDTDLRPFLLHGKMIAYQGWNDPFMKPELTIAFYEAVKTFVGNEIADNSYRLFMVSDMGHCAGGDGPNEFGGAFQSPKSGKDPEHNALLALEAWVETGRVPEKIIGSHYSKSGSADHPDLTQPLCPYPSVAKWNGDGDVHDAKNYSCGMYPSTSK